jgi:hypothetical protein
MVFISRTKRIEIPKTAAATRNNKTDIESLSRSLVEDPLADNYDDGDSSSSEEPGPGPG